MNWTAPTLLLTAISKIATADRSVDDVLFIARQCATAWDLEISEPFKDITNNFVAPAMSSRHGQAVLKIAFGSHMYRRECLALRLFSGRGAVRLLEWDDSLSAMLLQRVTPGLPMFIDWDSQTEVVCNLLMTLWRPATEEIDLPAVAWEAKARLRELGNVHRLLNRSPFNERCTIVERAIHTLMELTKTSQENFVVHGDLHERNILSCGPTQWISIDPIGCVGERAFDACTILRDASNIPFDARDPRGMVERRLRQISFECKVDEDRLRAWAFVEAVRLQGWRYRHGAPLEEWSAMIRILDP